MPACPKRLCAQASTGKVRGWRSSGQPLARRSRADGPLTRSTVRAWPRSVTTAGAVARAASSLAARSEPGCSAATTTQRPGPLHRTAVPPPRAARLASAAGATPQPAAIPPRTAASRSPSAATWTIAKDRRSLRMTPGPPAAGVPKSPGRAAPSRADRRSTMEPLPGAIVEDGIDDAHRYPLIGEREQRVQRLAVPRGAGFEEAEGDRVPQCRAVGRGGDPPDHRNRRRHARIRDDLRAGAQPRRAVDRDEADEARAPRIGERRTRQHVPADEIRLLHRDEAAEPEIRGGRRAVELGAGDVPLLDAQDPHRFHAVRDDAALAPGVEQRRPHAEAPIGRHVDLVGALAREADAEDADRDAGDAAVADAHMRQSGIADIDALRGACQHVPALRPGERHRRPLLGDGGRRDAELGPDRLQQEFEMLHDADGIRRRRRHEEALLGEARGRPIVEDDAVLAQHEAVARAPDGQVAEDIRVDAVEKGRGIRAGDIDLAESRDVDETDALAHGHSLAPDRLALALARARIAARAQPEARLDPGGAGRFVPLVHRRPADRLEMPAGLASGEAADRDRRIGRPKGRDAHRRDRLAALLGQEGEAVDVARLALVGAHAERRVALQMLVRDEALARREADIPGGHVVLEIDEALQPPARRHRPERTQGRRALARPVRRRRRDAGPEARRLRRLGSGAQPARDAVDERKRARRSFRLLGSAGHEGGERLVPFRPTARLAMEMQRRAPAARDAEEVTIEIVAVLVAGRPERCDLDGGDAAAAARREYGMAEAALDPGLPGAPRQVSAAPLARIDDRGHSDADA